jgi:hypothetical protein
MTFHSTTNRLFVLVDQGTSQWPHLMMLSTGLELLDVISLNIPQGGIIDASLTVDETTNALHVVLVTPLGCMRARVPIVTHRQQQADGEKSFGWIDSNGIVLAPLPGGELDDPAAWGAGSCTAQAAADGVLAPHAAGRTLRCRAAPPIDWWSEDAHGCLLVCVLPDVLYYTARDAVDSNATQAVVVGAVNTAPAAADFPTDDEVATSGGRLAAPAAPPSSSTLPLPTSPLAPSDTSPTVSPPPPKPLVVSAAARPDAITLTTDSPPPSPSPESPPSPSSRSLPPPSPLPPAAAVLPTSPVAEVRVPPRDDVRTAEPDAITLTTDSPPPSPSPESPPSPSSRSLPPPSPLPPAAAVLPTSPVAEVRVPSRDDVRTDDGGVASPTTTEGKDEKEKESAASSVHGAWWALHLYGLITAACVL